MGHYASEIANTAEDDREFRKIDQKYARMSQKERHKIWLETWLKAWEEVQKEKGK